MDWKEKLDLQIGRLSDLPESVARLAEKMATKEDVAEVKSAVDALQVDMSDVKQRVARIEGANTQ